MPTSSDFIPDDPKTIVLKPLTKGMTLSDDDQNSTDLRLISGADVTPLGLRRHGVWNNAYSSALPTFLGEEKLQKVGQLILSNGDTSTFVVTNRALYAFDATTGYSIVSWKQLYTVVSSSTNTVVLSGDITALGVANNDYVIVGSKGYKISNIVVSTNSTVTVTENWATAPSGGDSLKIVKPFQSSDYMVVSFACARGSAYFVDGVSTTMWVYDGDYMDAYVVLTTGTSSPAFVGATAIAYFKERLYFANILDSTGGSATRIRWTDVLDFTKSAAANYQDLETAISPIMSLQSTEDYLMAFTVADVYYSRATSLMSLPYAFYRAETGSIGAVGPMAISTVLNAVMFVGIDDVYIFSYNENNGPTTKRIGTAVAEEMLLSQASLRKTICITDVENSRVIVAVSNENDEYPRLWIYNMKTNAWSVDDSDTWQGIASSVITNQWRCSDFDPLVLCSSPLYANRTCYSFYVLPERAQLVGFTDDSFLQLYQNGDSGAVSLELVTKSLDFDAPTDRKVFTQAIIRADDLDATISMSLKVRLDESATWRTLGTFVLTPTQNEDILSFRVTCRRAQFKLESTSTASPWYLKYIALRVRGKGRMTAERRY